MYSIGVTVQSDTAIAGIENLLPRIFLHGEGDCSSLQIHGKVERNPFKESEYILGHIGCLSREQYVMIAMKPSLGGVP